MVSFRRAVAPGCCRLALAPAAAQETETPNTPSATVEIDQTQMAFIVSGSFGGGVLHYQGEDHHFRIGGLGVGGIGIAQVRASGAVYDLNNLADFAGVYGEVHAGYTVGTTRSGGLWLRNFKGVTMRLDTERDGLILTAGAGGIAIEMANSRGRFAEPAAAIGGCRRQATSRDAPAADQHAG